MGGSGNPSTAPGGSFTHNYNNTSTTTTFGTGVFSHDYTLTVTIADAATGTNSSASTNSNSQSATSSFNSSSSTVTTEVMTFEPTVASIHQLNRRKSDGSDGCFSITQYTGDGVVSFSFEWCPDANEADNKGSVTGRTGDCPNGSGGTAVLPNLYQYFLNKAVEYLDLANTPQAQAQAMYSFMVDDPQKTAIPIKIFVEAHGQTQEAKDFAKEALLAMMAEQQIINFAPLLKYPKGSDYETSYPKLTEYLKNQMPTIANISKITNALQEFTQLPLDQIKNDLKWGEGPEIEIIQLDNYNPGETDEDTAGYFDKSTPNKLYLDIDYINLVENETSDPDALIFWIGTTILHEYIHYGDNLTDFDYGIGDDGRTWEINVYRTDVQPDTARLVLNRQGN